LLANKLKKKDA